MTKMLKSALRKVGIAMLVAVCLLSAVRFSNVSAAETLTAEEKQILYNSGFPTSRSSYIDAYYNDFINNVDYYSYGYRDTFSAFQSFVSMMANASSPSGLTDFSIVARGFYSEVSGHTGYYQTELFHIADCIMNRLKSGYTKWDTYLKAAQYEGMNAINPNRYDFWSGTPVRNPLYDSALNSESRLALLTAFCIAWDAINSSSYRYSDLETGKYYFNESYVAGRHQAGHFYFY